MRPLATGLLALVVAAAPAALRAEDAAAKALLDRAVKAQGGADKVATLHEISLKAKGQLTEGGKNAEISFDMSMKMFDHARLELSVNEGGNAHKGTMVFAGDKAWFRDADRDKVEPAPPEFIPMMQSVFIAVRAASIPSQLTGNKDLTLAHGGESKVDDTPAEVLRITRKDRPDVTVYFDKKTGLPLRSETTVKDGPGGQDQEFVVNFHAFKDLGGVKHFTKLKITAGKGAFELELSELKLGQKFEASTFEKP